MISLPDYIPPSVKLDGGEISYTVTAYLTFFFFHTFSIATLITLKKCRYPYNSSKLASTKLVYIIRYSMGIQSSTYDASASWWKFGQPT